MAADEKMTGEADERRPTNCRNRLQAEGKPHPKSGCAYCKTGGIAGCPFERPPQPAGADPSSVRNAALEEAAACADAWNDACQSSSFAHAAARELAATIRAMKSKPDTPETGP